MKKILVSCTIILMVISCKSDNDSPITSASTFDVKQLRTEFVNQIETPATVSFQERITNLNAAITTFTNNLSETNLVALKTSWKAAAKQYSAIEVMAIGDVKSSLIMPSFYTWGANEVAITNYILSEKPITKKAINEQPTNMRGLSAIEFLLFEKLTPETITEFSNERRQRYLVVLGENLVEKASVLSTAWTAYRNTFINNTNTGINGSVNMLVNEMNALLENVRRFKVGEPAGLEVVKSPDALRLQAEKSGYSLELISENIKSIKQIYFETENSLDNYVAFITKSDAINTKMEAQFKNIENAVIALSNVPLKDAITTKPAKVKQLYDAIRGVLVLIKTDVASALSVTITFTDNDGD